MKPSEIREKALEIIQQHPQGIRQIDLIEKILEEYGAYLSATSDPKVTIRNAVWNLDEKMPHKVTKQNLGGRMALFLPKYTVTPDIKFRNMYVQEKSRVFRSSPKSIVESAWFVLTELEETLEKLGTLTKEIEELTPEIIGRLHQTDMDSIFELRSAIHAIRRSREIVANRKQFLFYFDEDGDNDDNDNQK